MKTGKNSLTEYRNELFGIATLMIVLCHSVSIVPFPESLGHLISYGTMGVNIFLFLSGIGLYYSLKNNGDYLEFYKKRFVRVLVPYLFIGGLWYGIRYLICEEGNIAQFLYELSTLSFWREHKGAWFVAAIVPIYIIYPLLFRWLEKGKRALKTGLLIAFILLIAFYLSNINIQLYTHLSQIIVGGCIFLVGNYVAESIRRDTFKSRVLFIAGLVLFAIKSVTSLKKIQIFCDMSVGMLSISIIFIINIFIKYSGRLCRCMLVKVGSISLESYLFNIFLLQAIKYWGNIFLTNDDFIYRLVLYIIIMILGLALAFLSSVTIKKLMKSMEEKRCQHLQEKL